jgi:catechol 2,3-dioxygenase-like lactoylglutathione lyase family enzyme
MDITIHASFLPHDDPDASLAFYRDTLGFEVRNDVERDGRRASLFMAGVRRPLRGSLASSVLATVRPLPSPEVKRLGLVPRTEVLRNG